MDLKKLSQEAFETAKAHGWHDEELPDETYLMLIITEIAEAVQADRKGSHADAGLFKADVETLDLTDDYDRDVWKRDFEIYIKETVEDELADIVIRCLDLLGLRNLNTYINSDYITTSIINLIESNPLFPEIAYKMCDLITNEILDIPERIGCIITIVFLYCEKKDIDIEWFITQKMRYNKLRPFRHGNKKY